MKGVLLIRLIDGLSQRLVRWSQGRWRCSRKKWMPGREGRRRGEEREIWERWGRRNSQDGARLRRVCTRQQSAASCTAALCSYTDTKKIFFLVACSSHIKPVLSLLPASFALSALFLSKARTILDIDSRVTAPTAAPCGHPRRCVECLGGRHPGCFQTEGIISRVLVNALHRDANANHRNCVL